MLERRPAHDRRRWLGLAALALTASALIPAALALACNPQAYLTLDKSQYAPGDSVRVSGSFFRGDANVTVSIDRTGQSVTIKTTGNGAFQTSFALPAAAPSGGYSVQAIGFEPNGDVVAGLPARGSFSVGTAPAASSTDGGQTAPATSEPAASAQPAAPAATPQAVRPTRSPANRTPASSFREPQVIDEPDVQKSRSTGSAGNAPRGDRATSNGREVFGGSVAPVPAVPSVSTGAPLAGATAATAPSAQSTGARADRSRPSSPSGGTSPQLAEQTATDDLWGALSPGASPSVLPVAGDGVSVGSQRAGSQLALGVMLLGAGMLALVGGLAAGEVRRRRVRAR